MLVGRFLLLAAAELPARRTMAAMAQQTCEAFEWHWLEETTSTQDAAKALVKVRPEGPGCDGRPLAVATAHQTKGRGTHGRAWRDDGAGNVALTVALPMGHVPLKPLTLVPLRVGVEIARVLSEALRARAPDCGKVSLKWPNDVLLDHKKVSGVLIEADGDHLFIGVGVNVNTFPDVPSTGPDRGREATSLRACGVEGLDARAIAKDLAMALSIWADGMDDPGMLILHWNHFVDWSRPLTLRDTGEEVLPLLLNPDGRLKVRPLAGGPERDLVAEYLI